MPQVINAAAAGTFTQTLGNVPELIHVSAVASVTRLTVTSAVHGTLVDASGAELGRLTEAIFTGGNVLRLADGELPANQCTITLVASAAVNVFATSTRKGQFAIRSFIQTIQPNSYERFDKFRKLAATSVAGVSWMLTNRMGESYPYAPEEMVAITGMDINIAATIVVDNTGMEYSAVQVNTAATAQPISIQQILV
jgi:hypothetical protein